MCSALDQLLGVCGYMSPNARFAVFSVLIAGALAMVLAARN